MSIPHQMTFEGREVSASKIVFPGLGEVDYIPPDGGAAPKQGDRMTYEVTFVVDSVTFPEKHDKDGVATDTLKRIAVLKPTWPGLSLKAVVSREDMLAAYDAAHSA